MRSFSLFQCFSLSAILIEVSSASAEEKCSEDLTCHNGGQCVQNSDEWECKCGKSPLNGRYYGGSSCESQLTGMTFCNFEDYLFNPNAPVFETILCYNDGQCYKDDDNHWACQCSTNQLDEGIMYGGDDCSHPVREICHGVEELGTIAPEELNVCYHGSCKGNGPVHELTGNSKVGNGNRIRYRSLETQPHPGCQCDDGWGGPHCATLDSDVDTASVTCPDGKTECLHGSTCVRVQDGKDNSLPEGHLYRCDCQPANIAHGGIFGGYQCEMYLGDDTSLALDTSSCHDQPSETSQVINSQSSVNYSVCLHGGTCTSALSHLSEEHTTCNCPEKFGGAHCEIPLPDPDAVSEVCNEDCSGPECLVCKNGGICDELTFLLKGIESCRCPEGYSGESCEIGEVPTNIEDNKDSAHVEMDAIYAVVGVFVSLGVLAACIVKCSKTRPRLSYAAEYDLNPDGSSLGQRVTRDSLTESEVSFVLGSSKSITVVEHNSNAVMTGEESLHPSDDREII